MIQICLNLRDWHPTGNMAEDFKRMLDQTKTTIETTSHEQEDLSPQSRAECCDHLDKTIEVLNRIKKDLTEAADNDPMTRTLLITGLKKGFYPSTEQIYKGVIHAYPEGLKDSEMMTKALKDKEMMTKALQGSKVTNEKNFEYSNKQFKQVDECYIQLKTTKAASYLASLSKIKFFHDGTPSELQVTFATKDENHRVAFRKIGALMARLYVVSKELESIGINPVNWGSTPTLRMDGLVCEETFDANLREWERARTAGTPLTCQAWAALKSQTPINVKKRTAEMMALYNEECDILILLRKFQRAGHKFEI